MTAPPSPQLAATSPRHPRGGAGAHPSGPAGTGPRSRAGQESDGDERVTAMAAGFVALFLEVEAGYRPRAHLRPLMTPLLYARLSDIWIRGGPAGQVASVRVAQRASTRCDVVVVVRRGDRWGAVSVCLVRHARRWVVDTLARPEDGALPAPAYPVPPEEPEDADDDDIGPIPVADADFRRCGQVGTIPG